jgi:hypothetical protein
MSWAGHAALKDYMRNACTVLLGRIEDRRLLQRPMLRWDINI